MTSRVGAAVLSGALFLALYGAVLFVLALLAGCGASASTGPVGHVTCIDRPTSSPVGSTCD